jgi:predicted ATPase/DNA-binding CsgD family transcriptional regulator
VAAILHLLSFEEVRLVTLTGPGGTGKTRLGLRVAAELSDTFTDGVYFVNLAPLSDPGLVVPTIAQTLAIKEVAGHPPQDLLKGSLHWKHLLLLLDNFEQVVDAAVAVADLLAVCPNLKVMVTSRMPLHVRGEQEFAVPPLAVPDPKRLPDLISLSQYEAVALFISRAQAVKPEFQVTDANARTIAEICVRLDGLPLAIELAAARIKVLPPQALLARLGQRLAVLTSGARDAPARQQTLRNTIAWSYHLLDAQEQRLFRQLSVFAGGFTLEAIEAICAALPDGAGLVFDGVASLLDKSLLQQIENEGEEPRLSMLETIREYGLEVLTTSGEMEVTRRAHALYYLALTEKAEPFLFGAEQGRWLDRLEQELDNVRAVLQWSFEQEESERGTEMALRLSSALRRFWSARGHGKEGRDLLERALATSKGAAASVRVKGLNATGWLALSQGDAGRAEALAQESLTLCREVGDIGGIAHSFVLLGGIAFSRGNLVAACSQTEESVALFRKLEDKTNIAWSLSNLAAPVAAQGEYTKARALLEESVALFQELGDKRGVASSLFDLAWVLFLSQSEPATVRPLLEQGLMLYREIGHESGIAESLSALARVTAAQGDHAGARTLYEESLTIAGKLGDKVQIASILEQLGEVIAVHGEFTRTARLWGAAEALRDAMAAPLPPVYRAEYEQAVIAVRSALGEKAFAAAWAEGRTMTPEQALAAQEKTMVPAPVSTGQSTSPIKPQAVYPDGLTAREVEVLLLVAQGLTDAQVAAQLVISPRTVNTHLKAIYGKIGVSSRSAATRYAMEHKLV